MAESYRDAAVFDCQVKAHKTFFEDELPHDFEPLPEEKRPPSTKTFKGDVYDITGFYGQRVVALLSQIVNDQDQFKKGRTFYLLIHRSSEDEFEELFRLTARPSLPDQPGNAIVLLRPRGRKKFKRSATSYEELNGALKGFYDKPDNNGTLTFSDTTSFARNIKQLFKNNAQIDELPQPTVEAYMLLLFEIARRLVKLENPSERKKAFDVLPIGSAIARLINLLELRKSSFEEVFFSKGRFHCFTGKPQVRRKAVEEINVTTMNIKYTTATGVTVPLSKEVIEKIETNRQLQELRELFCPDERPAETPSEEELTQLLKDLPTRIGQEKSGQSSWLQSSSNAESTTVFNHLE